ncbi:hypothetical protein JCM8547_003648 [Rhodosporidiobolus lusitaniae]
MRWVKGFALGAVSASFFLDLVAAQSSTVSDIPSSASTTATASEASGGNSTLTGTVVATGTTATGTSTSTSAAVPAPTSNSTTSTDQTVRLWMLEELVQCERVTFAFTGPQIAKTCGLYVTNSSTYLQQISLGGEFASLTQGTFGWLVDIPAGLHVDFQFWVSINGGIEQYTIHDTVVQPGNSSACIANGSGQNTASIASLASSLNSSWTYMPPTATSTSSGGVNGGTIAGGVIGALCGLALLLLITYLIYRRRKRSLTAPLPEGVEKGYDSQGGWGGSQGHAGGSFMMTTPPPGMSYAQQVAAQYNGQGGVVPYQSRAPGMAAEPMAAPSPPGTPSGPPGSPATRKDGSVGAGTSEFGRGTEGLEDPSTFLSRSTASARG